VPIYDNDSFEGYLEVFVNGPNDLSLCPLQQVCFEIDHTFVGDLCITLVSPGGLNYMVMADDYNGIHQGNAGNGASNLDVCIDVGTGNPLTNNTPYVCNGPPGTCLVGNWTVPCGGVTDPFTGAQQAPGCDLNAYNMPWQPANGTWTLVINDVWALDSGFLQTWSLAFACGILDCFTCAPDAGVLNQPPVMGCIGSPALNLNVIPQYPPPSVQPPPADYGYVWVVTTGGIITSFLNGGPNLNNLPPGNYSICGLSYYLENGTQYLAYLGQPYTNLVNALNSGSPPFCGDVSNCFTAQTVPPIPPTTGYAAICYGDCYTTPVGTECCVPGVCSYNVPSWLGCDSITNVIVTVIPPDFTPVQAPLCQGECITIAGVQYCEPGGYTIVFTGSDGCDSTVLLTVFQVPVLSVIGPPPAITCTDPEVTLDGSGSIGDTYQWKDPDGVVAGAAPTLQVNEPGCYTLIVWNTLNGETCSDTSVACVTADLDPPAQPLIQGPDTVCLLQIATYAIAPDPNATNYDWTLPTGAAWVSGGDGFTDLTVEWTGAPGGDICVFAVNDCGPSLQSCFYVIVNSPPAQPLIDGETQPCVDDVDTYTITYADPGVTGFSWTATNGGIILSGQGADTIEVQWPVAGPAQVCVSAENACGLGPEVCFDLEVTAYPTPGAGPDDGICGLDYTLSGSSSTGAGVWTASGPGTALFADDADPQTSVSVDAYGLYMFTWTETSGNCSSQDEAEISFNSIPQPDSAIVEDCTPDGQNYTVSFSITGGQPPYTVTGTAGGVVNGAVFTSDLIPSGTSYTFDVTDSFGCGPLTVAGQVTCNCISDAGDLDLTPLAVCEDQTVTVAAPANAVLDPNDTFEFILHSDNGTNGNTLGTIIDQNATGTFGFVAGMIYNTTYFISYAVGNDTGGGVDLGDNCTDLAQGVPVVFHDYPVPDAGADDAVCGLSYSLQALAGAYPGQWTLVGGPGAIVFANPADPLSQVDVDQYGSYTFLWTEDNDGCQALAQVVIDFNDDPVLDGVVTETCNMLDFTYTVAFNITGGEQPYTVMGPFPGVVTGNAFLSDPIANLTAYSFEVFDANGCGPLLVEGMVDCTCGTDAGQMDASAIQVCADGTAIGGASAGAVLDAEDILLYVLHNGSGNALGTEVYSYNTVPEFALIPPMQTGATYYISAIAGNDLDGDGVIDTNDPCVSVAAGTPVEFLPLPSATFAGDATVCEGETALLSLLVTSATCVDIDYVLSDGTSGTLTCVQTGNSLSVPAGNASLTATLLQVTDQDGCTQALNETGNVTVNTIPVATVTPTATICNSTTGGNPTVLDFSTLVTAGDQGGTWVNTGGAAVTGTFPLIDFNGTVPGVYSFTYITASALPPCPESSYVVQVTVESCACPLLDFLPAAPLCNDGGSVDLNTLQVESNPGTYAITGTPGGAVNFPQINGSVLDATGADPGLYTLTFTLSIAPPPGCPQDNSFDIAISGGLTAGSPGLPAELCFGGAQTIDLNSLLTGADPGGVWTETSATSSTGGAFNAVAGTFSASGQAAQTYRFRYTVTPDAPCTPGFAEAEVIIHSLPYPSISLTPISCYGQDDGEISVDSISGEAPPYLVSINGGPFQSNTVFNNLAPATYSLVVEDANGCRTDPGIIIGIQQPLEINVTLVANLGGENVILPGEAVEMEALVNIPGSEIDTVFWLPAGLLDCDTCLKVVAVPLETTTFSVTIESNGCSDSDALQIVVRRAHGIFAPNIFSPNADGLNDIFQIFGGEEVASVHSFLIFNRWGEPVHRRFDCAPNDPALGWDGTFNGKPLNPGVLTWFAEVEFIDGRVEIFKGNVSLVR